MIIKDIADCRIKNMIYEICTIFKIAITNEPITQMLHNYG